MAFAVGEPSRLTGITVRTLHQYDEIGCARRRFTENLERLGAGYAQYLSDAIAAS